MGRSGLGLASDRWSIAVGHVTGARLRGGDGGQPCSGFSWFLRMDPQGWPSYTAADEDWVAVAFETRAVASCVPPDDEVGSALSMPGSGQADASSGVCAKAFRDPETLAASNTCVPPSSFATCVPARHSGRRSPQFLPLRRSLEWTQQDTCGMRSMRSWAHACDLTTEPRPKRLSDTGVHGCACSSAAVPTTRRTRRGIPIVLSTKDYRVAGRWLRRMRITEIPSHAPLPEKDSLPSARSISPVSTRAGPRPAARSTMLLAAASIGHRASPHETTPSPRVARTLGHRDPAERTPEPRNDPRTPSCAPAA